MKAAKLETSQRLQKVDALLADGAEHSTIEIIQQCGVCAVNSIIGELRENGRQINGRWLGGAFYYRRIDA